MKNYKNSITNLVLLFIFLIPTTSHAEIDSLWAKVYDYCEQFHTYGSMDKTNDGNLLFLARCAPDLDGDWPVCKNHAATWHGRNDEKRGF